MTTKELNKDIKKLANEIYRMSFESQEKYFAYIANDAKKEFTRLYYADSNFEYMNLNSVKLMFRLNLSHRFIQLHQLGLQIDYTKLL